LVDRSTELTDFLDVLDILTRLLDGRYRTYAKRRSSLQSIFEGQITHWLERARDLQLPDLPVVDAVSAIERLNLQAARVVVDAGAMASEGKGSLAVLLQRLRDRGFEHMIVLGARGHRFIGNGLGPGSQGVRIEVYGSSGDYLASGLDGADLIVHGSGQDQIAQIMKSGTLVVHGDVGQTFMYGAKGGEAYILGNAAGRPLINAVGRPRVVINGTCLDYLAESFMAGDPLNGGGMIVLNGIRYAKGQVQPLDTPYPGGNLFSLASGGAICVRDPNRTVGEDQLNGGKFIDFDPRYWEVVQPLLERNQAVFGIRIEDLLTVEGSLKDPGQVYRIIIPAGHEALQPEEAWVRH
jgi:glutamate synthase domain-containing protein 3